MAASIVGAGWIFPFTLLDNYDGDTFEVDLDLGFGVHHIQTVRLYGVDTPERRGGSRLTKALANLARTAARGLIEGADLTTFQCIDWSGKYGRAVGHIWLDGRSLSEELIRQRLGVRYISGPRRPLRAKHEENASALVVEGLLSPA